MVKVRLSNSPPPPHRRPKSTPAATSAAPTQATAAPRGLTERQWVIVLLVTSALLLMVTFRGCILPTGVGPKQKPAGNPQATTTPAVPTVNASEYTVIGGDNLSKIAEKLGVSVDALRQANNLDRSSILQVGQKLKVPPK